MEVLAAVAGVAGGAPPATVEIEYCCAKASAAPASSRRNFACACSLETSS